MNRPGTLALVLALALLAIGGIVTMLLVGGGWDWLAFALAALPLAVGGWCRRAARMRASDGAPASLRGGDCARSERVR